LGIAKSSKEELQISTNPIWSYGAGAMWRTHWTCGGRHCLHTCSGQLLTLKYECCYLCNFFIFIFRLSSSVLKSIKLFVLIKQEYVTRKTQKVIPIQEIWLKEQACPLFFFHDWGA
jgi:hypothetical protein